MLVIGGCAAGMSGASAARRENENLTITVLEKGKYISYGSCAIPYYIEGRIPDWKPLVHHTPEEFKEKRNINVLINAEAKSVNTEKKIVTYIYKDKEEQIQYNKLLISTGAHPFDPFKANEKYSNLYLCRNVEDAIRIKEASDKGSTKKAIVLGSGYIGLEVACAFKEKGIDVEVFDMSDHILRGYIPEIYNEAYDYLINKGIKINLSEGVKDFKGDDGVLETVITDKNEYTADIVLLAIGARPSTDFLIDTDIELGPYGEIKIDKSMQTNVKDVFAAGDCAGTYNAFSGEYTYFPLAQTANRQGKIAGINIAMNKLFTLKGVVKTQAMKLFDIEIGSVGFSPDEAKERGYDPEVVTIQSYTKAYKHLGSGKIKISLIFNKKDGLILGAQMIGAEGTGLRVNIFTAAMFSKMTVEDFWNMDLVYVPPVAPVYDSTLVAARAAMNKLEK